MLLIALVLSLLVGLSLGIFGGGGSVLSVSVFSLVLGMSPQAAVAASLLVTGVTSLVALLRQGICASVCERTAVTVGGAGMLGAFAGGRAAAFVPASWLLAAFAIVMLVTSVAMLRQRTESRAAAGALRLEKLATLALTTGVVTGLLGAGGGLLLVPALVRHGGMPMPRAVATSQVVLALQSFAGFVGHDPVRIDYAIVAPFTLLATLGVALGTALAERAPQALLRRGVGVLLLGLVVARVAHAH